MGNGSTGDVGRYSPIEDYAVIGDCRSAALVSRDGSIDWLCFPRFDSPSIFAALLDTHRGGRFRIRPAGDFRVERRYAPDTNVLEATFSTADGSVRLRDLMPVASEAEKRSTLMPSHQILRELEGLDGAVELEIFYQPRPNYARLCPIIDDRGPLGFRCEAQGAVLSLRSELPLSLDSDRHAVRGTVRIGAGERHYLAFTYSTEAPDFIPPMGEIATEKVDRSIRWWMKWASRCAYEGPYRDAVIRSALTLKLMAYAPSGAVIAAPTTSLPERIGGERNWDYRYCWLRDASFTLRALFSLGYEEEALAFLNWMLHATRLTWPELQVLYNVFGETKLPESELTHLQGYAGSRPVRIGNDARNQLQLDVYGEVLDAVAAFADRAGRFDRDTVKMLNGLGHTVCDRWREPDEGIWEGRAGRQQHTHSKVLCWVALDRLIHLHEIGKLDGAVDRFRAERAAIQQAIETRGYNTRIQSYTRIFDGESVDAALLTIPLYGYRASGDHRIRATFERIRATLSRGPLFYRYQDTDDGLPPGEGAFGICSFWAVECLARSGELDQAVAMFEELLGYRNDVGLYPEEFDPDTGAALGNFPQTFTHVGLINSALALAESGHERLVRKTSREADELEKEEWTV